MRYAAPLLAALAACSPPAPPPSWWHAQQTPERFARDRHECLREANTTVPSSQQITTIPGTRSGEFTTGPVVQSHDANAGRRATAMRVCMEARGYVLSPSDPWRAQRAATR